MIKFLIDHIDPLGQGVFKKDEDIFFVPKTLPGEEGFLEIIKKTKGVHFCRVIKLTKKSSLRKKSSCSHFYNCNGCNFLHTDYEQ
jgi:23S rRNA (uracil1939-C5)-methyltransferase